MKTIYRCSFLVGVVILVAVGLSGCRQVEIPPVFVPTSTALATVTPRPTPTPTATETPTPTLVEFSTGLPTSVAGCNVWPEDPEAYKIWVVQRNAAETAWFMGKTEADFGLDFSRGGENDDENLPYNTMEIDFGSERMIGCSRSEDSSRVVFSIAIDGEHVLHVMMVPEATEAYQTANDTDFELMGGKTDVNEMLEAISQGKKLNIAVKLFTVTMNGDVSIIRTEKMAGWEWVDLGDLDKPVPLSTSTGVVGPEIKRKDHLIFIFVKSWPFLSEKTQADVLDTIGEINVPAAELGWWVIE